MNPSVLSFLFFFVSCAFAREYPAGLHPALCPDYPNCDNELLARYNLDGQPRPVALTAAAHDVANPIHYRAAEWPADVPAAACPNYPFCNVAVGAEPLPGFAQRLYPAGVPAAACPGYPYC